MTRPLVIRCMIQARLTTAALALCLLPAVCAQTPAPNPAPNNTSLEFEVASIKPDTGASGRSMISLMPGGRFVGENVPARILITYAYDIRDYQIAGAPSWLSSEPFDINAKSEIEKPSPDQLRLMMRALLADRLKLTFHREMKESPVYDLVPAKGGLKLTESGAGSCVAIDRDHPPAGPPPPGAPIPKFCGNIQMGRGQINAYGVPMARLVDVLSNLLGRAVIDKTGAAGTYNVHLEFTPDQATMGGPLAALPPPGGGAAPPPPPPPDSASPNIFTALQEQLGLKVDSSKGAVEMLVIDHIERPSEN